MEIRTATVDDAGAFLEHCLTLDNETRFMMLEPGERTTKVEEQAQRIRRICAAENQTLILAVEDNKVVGHVLGLGGRYRRNSRTAHVVVGVLGECSGRGIATQILSKLEHWAKGIGIRRLELTVMSHNERAVGLYKKIGFEVEGLRKDSLYVDGRYVDEYSVAKLLG